MSKLKLKPFPEKPYYFFKSMKKVRKLQKKLADFGSCVLMQESFSKVQYKEKWHKLMEKVQQVLEQIN